MASADLSRRVEKVVGYPPVSEMGDLQRREFHEALLEAATFEDLPGRWQAAILEAEQETGRSCGSRTVVEWYPGGVDCGRYLPSVVEKANSPRGGDAKPEVSEAR